LGERKKKGRCLGSFHGEGGAAAQCGSIRIAPRRDLPRVGRWLRESRAVDPALLVLVLLPPSSPPRKGWIFMAFCAFCVGELWILGVGCAWGYLHSG